MPNLSLTIRAGASGRYVGPSEVDQSVFELSTVDSFGLEYGGGDDQSTFLHRSRRSLAASADELLDLSSGLTDVSGAAVLFTKIRFLILKADRANAHDITIGGGGDSPGSAWLGPFSDVTDKVTVKPGGLAQFFAPISGYTVTPGTGDLLAISNAGAVSTVNFDLIIAGN